MRVGVDVQVVADGNRSGLYTCLRSIIRELRPLLGDELRLFAARTPTARRVGAHELSALMEGTEVRLMPSHEFLRRLYFTRRGRAEVEVFLHNLHGTVPRLRHAANAYLVPDVIPLAIDYGVPQLIDSYLPFYKAAVKNADVILVFSEHAKRDLLDRVGGRPELVYVAALAASPEFRPRSNASELRAQLAPLGLADVPYVLLVATLERRKNHQLLIRAFARMVHREADLPHKLVLVGGRWIGHEEVFDTIHACKLEDRVMYLGFSDKLPALYAGCDAFVFPSRYEGFGLPVLEAMASGVPVLAAATTSLPEVVGDAGVLFEPDDVEGLADALGRVLLDRELHDDLVARGQRRASEFSWQRTAQRCMDAFEFAMQRRAISAR